ncbi:MAG: hypothetical protein HQK94_04095 [Nitrospirae bacterium]|nr:hypothetical protein [Nitrospirota bacterium]MBF0534056.1 hypothetical protein [Nitrospirota bacterium]
MHQKYDLTLKKLLKDIPAKFLKILTGYETGKFLDIQLPNIQYWLPDLIIELPDCSILHIEIQSASDGTMLMRMYLYSALIFSQYGRMPRQIVLYVGNKPHKMKNDIGTYSYEIKDIRDINCSELLQSDKPEDTVLALLCNSDNMDVTITKILEKLSTLPIKTMNDYIVKLLNIADLRKLADKVKKEVKNMPITIDVRESTLFQEGLIAGKQEGLITGKQEGLIAGKQEGLFEGKRQGLLEGIELGLELKFGLAGLDLMNIVRAVNTLDKLEEFKNLIKTASSVEALKEFLSKSV